MSDAAVALVLVAVAVCGLVTGSLVNVAAYRVPTGIPLRRASHCPQCTAPVRGWRNLPIASWIALRGRCQHCRARIPIRLPLVEAGTAVAFVVVAAWMLRHPGPLGPASPWAAVLLTTVAYLYFAAVSILLALTDIDVRRLPDVIVLPSYPIAVALLATACLLAGEWSPLARGAVGLLAMVAFYGLPRLIRPDGVGGGDVKLSGLIGLHLGFLGWPELIVGAFAAFLLGGVHSVVLLVTRRGSASTTLPFGPWMLAGAWVGIFAGSALAGEYLGGSL